MHLEIFLALAFSLACHASAHDMTRHHHQPISCRLHDEGLSLRSPVTDLFKYTTWETSNFFLHELEHGNIKSKGECCFSDFASLQPHIPAVRANMKGNTWIAIKMALNCIRSRNTRSARTPVLAALWHLKSSLLLRCTWAWGKQSLKPRQAELQFS